MPSIFLHSGDRLLRLAEAPYERELDLQNLLSDHPELIAGVDAAGEPKRWMLVAPETGVPDREEGGARWSLDHLFIDDDGLPTLVEVKRATDTRARREVVAQMLDYAANAKAYWAVGDLREAMDTSANVEGADARVAALLGIHAISDDAEERIEQFWQTVDSNLRTGRLRLVFVADAIHADLQRIVEFLNEQMERTEVLAIEVRQYIDAESPHKILVPRTIGNTARAQDAKSASTGRRASRQRVTEAEVAAAIAELQSSTIAQRTRALWSAFKSQGAVAKLRGKSLSFALGEGQRRLIVSAWLETGESSLNLVYFAKVWRREDLDALLDDVAAIAPLTAEVDRVRSHAESTGKWGWLDLTPALKDDDDADALTAALLGAATAE